MSAKYILPLAIQKIRAHKVKAASIWTAHRFTSPQYCTCENFATRFRIGELSEVQTKSSALGHCCKRQVSLDSGKDIPAKRIAYSDRLNNPGVKPAPCKGSHFPMQPVNSGGLVADRLAPSSSARSIYALKRHGSKEFQPSDYGFNGGERGLAFPSCGVGPQDNCGR